MEPSVIKLNISNLMLDWAWPLIHWSTNLLTVFSLFVQLGGVRSTCLLGVQVAVEGEGWLRYR